MLYEPFPLITYKKKSGTVTKVDLTSTGWQAATIPKDVLVHSCPVGGKGHLLNEAIAKVLGGSVVLWIENTVAEAQETYALASRELTGESLGLLHSRYMRKDRDEAEETWISRLGKGGHRTPCLLISTQVCEQSIDIDADVLYTSLCPSDMMLQRIGRMWRHRSNDVPRKVTDPEVFWFGPDRQLLEAIEGCTAEKDLFLLRKRWGKSAFVYDLYTLCRTAEVWLPLTSIRVPGDIRKILEETYA
jgi:CRISPR-associated endonuclease/helicase Cas3